MATKVGRTPYDMFYKPTVKDDIDNKYLFLSTAIKSVITQVIVDTADLKVATSLRGLSLISDGAQIKANSYSLSVILYVYSDKKMKLCITKLKGDESTFGKMKWGRFCTDFAKELKNFKKKKKKWDTKKYQLSLISRFSDASGIDINKVTTIFKAQNWSGKGGLLEKLFP